MKNYERGGNWHVKWNRAADIRNSNEKEIFEEGKLGDKEIAHSENILDRLRIIIR